MKIGLIFDLDQTLIDTSKAETFRTKRNWSQVYSIIPSFSPYHQMDSVLEYIDSNNIPYCIVTSSQGQYCKKVCVHWKFKHETAVCFHDTNNRKPHPEPILLAVERLKIPTDHIFSFGDRDIDIVASNEAGVKSVACLWGADDTQSLIRAKPTHILETPIEIIRLIEDFI